MTGEDAREPRTKWTVRSVHHVASVRLSFWHFPSYSGRAPRPSPDYSLVDGIAATSSTSSCLCPPRETDFQPTSDHSNKTRKRGGRSERGRRAAGALAFEVRSTRLTGVDQISEGEIIQGRRRRVEIETKPPSRPTISRWPSFFSFSLSLSLSLSLSSQER